MYKNVAIPEGRVLRLGVRPLNQELLVPWLTALLNNWNFNMHSVHFNYIATLEVNVKEDRKVVSATHTTLVIMRNPKLKQITQH